MKRWIITAAVGIASFAAGCFAGWQAKKHTEVKFEEVTEEELNAYAEADMEKRKAKNEEESGKPGSFSFVTPEFGTAVKDAAENVKKMGKTMQAINTAKIDYAAKWKDGEGQYVTKSELPEGEDPVITEEDVENVNLEEDLVIDDQEEVKYDHGHLPAVEESDEDEYNLWYGEQDGEYQAMEVTWFAGDNVVVDEDGDPIGAHVRYLGFDPKAEFAKMGVGKDESAVLYRKNNLLQIIYQVNRYPASYGKTKHAEEYGGDEDDG